MQFTYVAVLWNVEPMSPWLSRAVGTFARPPGPRPRSTGQRASASRAYGTFPHILRKVRRARGAQAFHRKPFESAFTLKPANGMPTTRGVCEKRQVGVHCALRRPPPFR